MFYFVCVKPTCWAKLMFELYNMFVLSNHHICFVTSVHFFIPALPFFYQWSGKINYNFFWQHLPEISLLLDMLIYPFHPWIHPCTLYSCDIPPLDEMNKFEFMVYREILHDRDSEWIHPHDGEKPRYICD